MNPADQGQTLDLTERFKSAKSIKATELPKTLESAKAWDMVVVDDGTVFCAVPDKTHDDHLNWVQYNGESDEATLRSYSEWIGKVDETYSTQRRSRQNLEELRIAILSLVNLSNLVGVLGGQFAGPTGEMTDYFHAMLPIIVHATAVNWMKGDGVDTNSEKDVEFYNTLVYKYVEEFANIISQKPGDVNEVLNQQNKENKQ